MRRQELRLRRAAHRSRRVPVMAAIGQSNNNYTTVQLSRYVTAVANGGTVYQYTLLNRLEDSDGNVLKVYDPQVRNTVDVLDTSQWISHPFRYAHGSRKYV